MSKVDVIQFVLIAGLFMAVFALCMANFAQVRARRRRYR